MTNEGQTTKTPNSPYIDPRVPQLLEALQDRDWQQRARAAETLGKIGDPATVPHLLWALYGDRDEWARASLIRNLGKIGDPSAIPALAEQLNDTSWWFDQRICDIAAAALEAIGTPEALDVVGKWRREQENTPRKEAGN